ncbi:MAG: hypothetical protein MJZ76_10910 [Bacteroidales bacterium]|nr:hypothetical protein [Bacteroidales bacterium]
MEPENKSVPSSSKKNWLFFAVGLLVGFVLSFSIYFCDRYLFNDKIHFSSTIDHLYSPIIGEPEEVEVVKEVRENKAKLRVTRSNVEVDSLDVDSLYFNEPGELEEPEFEVDNGEEEIDVLQGRVLESRKVKVQRLPSDTLPASCFVDYIEVESWSSPIKNKHSYWFSDKTLKITGMEISRVKIVYANGEYYLMLGSSYFLLKYNREFESLIETKLYLENE